MPIGQIVSNIKTVKDFDEKLKMLGLEINIRQAEILALQLAMMNEVAGRYNEVMQNGVLGGLEDALKNLKGGDDDNG